MLKNALRSGDIWVEGSRQFRNFNQYLQPAQRLAKLREAGDLRLNIELYCEPYLKSRLEALNEQLQVVDSLAGTNDLPDAILTDSDLQITPLDASVPPAAQRLIDQIAASLPHIRSPTSPASG